MKGRDSSSRRRMRALKKEFRYSRRDRDRDPSSSENFLKEVKLEDKSFKWHY
jgi:hypothetical protein